MDYDQMKYHILLIYEQYRIRRLPFECTDLLEQMNYRCIKYSHLPDHKRNACLELSEDACTIGNTIYYNDRKTIRRIRFSLMHEMGHIILKTEQENEANLFASNILAPSIAIHYAKTRNISELSDIFNISRECAGYAKDFYKKWLFSVKNYGMTDIDRKMYQHFYMPEYDGFVFKETPCVYCETIIINSCTPICQNCGKTKSEFQTSEPVSDDFRIAENSWLYKGL